MRRLLLLSLPLLALAALRAEEDPPQTPPDPPPAEQPPAEKPPPLPQKPVYEAGRVHGWLEQMAKAHGWTLTFKEDDDLVVAGTCDPATLEDGYKLARQGIDKAATLLKVQVTDFKPENKLYLVYLARKAEYMAYAEEQEKATHRENLVKLLDTVPASGGFLCLDASYGVNHEARRHLTAHNIGHEILNAYAKHLGGFPIPGWLAEGFPAWMDSTLTGAPGSCCVAKVGYDGEQFQKRGSDGRWDRAAFQVVKDYKDGKVDPATKKPAYTRLGNLVGTKFDKLTGADVAVAWMLVREMAEKRSAAFKAFLDAVLTGAKQADAFPAAFKKNIDDYEKAWIEALLKNPPEEPKKK